MMTEDRNVLYLVGTPIGNLSDLSPRAIEVMTSVDAIACEDTRRTGLLLSGLGIKKRLISYHEHNRAQKGRMILDLLQQGLAIALVSDAGMPCISDPGEELVRDCSLAGIGVVVIPGPVAGISALALSGLDSKRFFFEGFLPSDGKDRKQRLQDLLLHRTTFILYEAPHRILRTLEDMMAIGLGNRKTAVCRELTKKHEEVLRMTVEEAHAHFLDIPPRGEFVLVVEGGVHPDIEEKRDISEQEREDRIRDMLSEGLSTKDISQILSLEWKESRKTIYASILKMLN
jgi:16S rRNA (cytidine1402-2'-O)-methyltransferase